MTYIYPMWCLSHLRGLHTHTHVNIFSISVKAIMIKVDEWIKSFKWNGGEYFSCSMLCIFNQKILFLPFLFFSFIFISWRLITLQFCSISSISNGSVVPNAIRITWMDFLNPSSCPSPPNLTQGVWDCIFLTNSQVMLIPQFQALDF